VIGLVVTALVPVVLLIGLGAVLRHTLLTDGGFWSEAERLSYHVLLPALFFHGLATADVARLPVGDLAAVLVCSTVIVSVLVVLLWLLLRRTAGGDAFTSVFQGSVRFNNYIGVTVAAGMYGGEGVAYAAVCNAVIVPMVNVLCVLVFARFGSVRLGPTATLRQIVTNPLILGCAGGIAVHALGLGLPAGIGPVLGSLGSASMPLGLLCVGAALRFSALRSWAGQISIASAMKFVAMPAVTFLLAQAFGLGSRALVVAMLFQALPTASSAYMLARRLGGDAPLMAGITAVQTLVGMLAMPLVLLLAT
jgi:malonate transporter and related proteins